MKENIASVEILTCFCRGHSVVTKNNNNNNNENKINIVLITDITSS